MLQIISNSNETKTGPELVQNGDFSQLGTDLVENGEFDELGTDVITNGGFTGVTELVADGDFSLTGTQAESTTGTYWTTGSKWVINSNSAYTDATAYSNLSTYSVFESGKTYTITVEVSGGNCRVYFGTSATTLHLLTDGLNTITAVAEGTKLTFRAYTTPTTISNVSVKEEGEDWTQGIGWTIGDSKATSTQALGSEEVTNGDFSAAGINLVDNPNFTDTGSELVTNGDFATDSDWTFSNIGGSNGWRIADGRAICDTSAATKNRNLTSSLSLDGSKDYKLTIDILQSADNITVYVGGTALSPKLPTGENLGYEYYISSSDHSGGALMFYAGSSDLQEIDNVSVKELGADWTVLNADATHYVEFIETGARFVFATTSPAVYLNQPTTLLANKSYKLTVDLTRVSGGVKLEGGGITEIFNATTSGTNNTRYITPTSNIYLQFLRSSSNVDLTFHSVSVQELGEGWTLTAATIGEDEATIVSPDGSYAGISQSNVTISGKTYKYSLEIKSISGNLGLVIGGVSDIFSTVGTKTGYVTAAGTYLEIKRGGGVLNATITNISVKEIATSYLTQGVSLSAKTWKIIYSVSDYIAGSVSATDYGVVTTANAVGITEYVQIGAVSDFRMVNIDGYFEGAVTGISAELVDPNGYWTLNGWVFGEDKASNDGVNTGNLNQDVGLQQDKSYLIKGTISNYNSGTLQVRLGLGATIDVGSSDGTFSIYLKSTSTNSVLRFYPKVGSLFNGSVTNISVEQVDPNDYWTLGTGWSIGTDKAISTVTGSNSDITQSILTAGKTYRTVYEIVDYDAGTAQAVVTGSAGADAVAIETYTEDLTTTGTDFSIRSKLGTFDGAVSSVSAKLLGSYEDQSIYVTAADVQTLPQASVYYLVELTSMASKNSIYFIPSSVVPNNGRYTKLNFTVVSKDALTQPTVGIISFYDSAGGFDTYPMGFYEFKIYEQTSSTNLDPLLATGLLEKGFAFVRDFSGNMQELTDGFKEYNPTLTQYVYSK